MTKLENYAIYIKGQSILTIERAFKFGKEKPYLKKMNKQSTRENKCKCPLSLGNNAQPHCNRETQRKTAAEYHSLPIQLAEIQKIDSIVCGQGHEEIITHIENRKG